MPENRLWAFEGEELEGKTNLSIGKKMSKYNVNELTKETIIEYLSSKFAVYPKFKLETLNIPTQENHQIEHTNRLFRESFMKDQFDLQYPKMDGTKYDIIINGYKVQDKCGRKVKHVNSYLTSFDHKYKKGDNDYYWIFMPDTSFYILPESILIIDNKIKSKITLNDKVSIYHYKSDDSDLIEKMKVLFSV